MLVTAKPITKKAYNIASPDDFRCLVYTDNRMQMARKGDKMLVAPDGNIIFTHVVSTKIWYRSYKN
jgi:hypothetical protein